jgi:hypothetical protein
VRISLSLTYLSIFVLALVFTPLGCEEDDAGDDWIVDDTEIIQAGTNLVWLRCPLGQTWDEVECLGTRQGMDWETAEASCPAGYRLPAREEFIDVLGGCDDEVAAGRPGNCDNCKNSDTCNPMFGVDIGWYWSLSPGPDDTAYLAGFGTGYIANHRTDAGYGVRCLREQ